MSSSPNHGMNVEYREKIHVNNYLPFGFLYETIETNVVEELETKKPVMNEFIQATPQ